MFYRRKLLLSLLEIFGNELEKIRLQKLLFLLTKKQVKQDYEFVPYKSNVTALTRQRRWGVGLMGCVNTDRYATGMLLIHYNFVSVGFSWGQQFSDVNKTQIGIMAGLNWYF